MTDPWSTVWEAATSEVVPLSAQTIAPPLGGGSVAAVTARALHDRQRLYFLIEWEDDSVDDSVAGAALFSDAAAVQFQINGGDAPYTMGAIGLPVNIWQWKAVWQADIESGYETVQDRLPNTYVDDYQQADDPLFRTGEAVGNVLAQRERTTPVENLVAEGFGTLTTSDTQDVDGVGLWQDGVWRVLFARDLGASAPDLTSFEVGGAAPVAFAIWDGGMGDRNGQKSIAPFIDMRLVDSAAGAPGSGSTQTDIMLLVLTMTVAAIAVYGLTRGIKEPDSRE